MIIYIIERQVHFLQSSSIPDFSLQSQKAVISTPDIGYSFSINPPWTWKNSPLYWMFRNSENPDERPDIGYSFSINPPWTWKNSSHQWGVTKSIFKKEKILVEKDNKKDSHPLNNVLNTSFGLHENINNTIEKIHIQNNDKQYKTSGSLSTVFHHFRKDNNHRLSPELRNYRKLLIPLPSTFHEPGKTVHIVGGGD
ncbi:hypothetical protein H8356DRAFT_1344645 [Neocallimastix lanati (nom. inval.)]|nr:hypothetical protein H8356DRAFT_1344645 [Neocallimastix sp. JGI-2020a]